MKTIEQIQSELTKPFDPSEVKFKPQMVKGNRALALAYVDARVIEDRLDDVVGIGGWQDNYEILNDGSVVCRLSVKFGDTWITKTDVGSQSEQPDGGDRMKSAFSDALKRAAVKFGVGRYLYRTSSQWCDYDPVKKQFVNKPTLSSPQRQTAVAPALQAAPPAGLSPELVKVLTEMIAAVGNHDAYIAAKDELSRQKQYMTKQQFNTFAGLMKEASERIA